MKKFIFVLIALKSMTTFAADVTGIGKDIILVENKVINGYQKVSFKYCEDRDQPKTCYYLGNKNEPFYKISEITDQRFWLKSRFAATVMADAGIVVATFFGGWVGGGALFSSTEALTYMYGGTAAAGANGIIIGAGVGTAMGVGADIALAALDVINPVEQFRKLSTITNEVIYDRPVPIHSPLNEFAARLSTVLSYIK